MQNDIEDNDLEKALVDNFIHDKNEGVLDEYHNGREDPQLVVVDEELANPRAYPHPKPWLDIGTCIRRCRGYNNCRNGFSSFRRCFYPRGCDCNRFARAKY